MYLSKYKKYPSFRVFLCLLATRWRPEKYITELCLTAWLIIQHFGLFFRWAHSSNDKIKILYRGSLTIFGNVEFLAEAEHLLGSSSLLFTDLATFWSLLISAIYWRTWDWTWGFLSSSEVDIDQSSVSRLIGKISILWIVKLWIISHRILI